ncbi:MAG: hypothetical protein R3A79_25840 [Nannocystaceae bacterium]
MTRSIISTRFTSLSLFAAMLAAPLAGCSGDDTSSGTSATESSSSSSSSTSDSGTSTSAGSESDSGSDSSTGSTSSSTTDTTVTTTTTTGVDPQPDGAMCSADEECISNSCFVVPLLGGLCGECKVDADCEKGGCTIPNPLAGEGATCNEGEVGAGCQTDDVCADPNNPYCGLVLDATPIIKVQTCGECKSNADCSDDAAPNCSPEISVADFSGVLSCVPDASVANNSACNHVEEGGVPIGNSACESGMCGVATVMGVVKIGVCGECFTDEDCDGKTCQDAYVDTDTGELFGAMCV